jgi:hypothetical protein
VEKQITYKGKPIKITDFSTETLTARRTWSEEFQAIKENNFSPRTLYPAKLSFKIDGGMKIFHNEQKLKQYMTTKPPLQKILQRTVHKEGESKQNHERTGSIKLQEKKRQSEPSIDLAAHTQKIHKKQKQPSGRNHHILININIECQCTQIPHQKTPFGKLD